MFGSTVRRAAMVVALPALVASATASPALASGSGSTDYYKKVVHVKICKEIKDKKDNKGKNHKFYIHAWTYNSVSKDYYDYVDKDDVYVHTASVRTSTSSTASTRRSSSRSTTSRTATSSTR